MAGRIYISGIQSNDLKKLQENYEEVSLYYKAMECRKKYFLAACQLFYPEIDYEIALKLRPYGGLIGIENSRLDNYLKVSKVLRLHAILHDAAGFIRGHYGQGPGYSYVIQCPINSCFIGHMSGIMFCLFQKIFRGNIFSCIEC